MLRFIPRPCDRCLEGSAPLIVNTEFKINEALQVGAGLYAIQSSPTVVGCEFEMNLVGDYGQGGGVKLTDCTSASFTDCLFNGNGAMTCVGGGMHANGSTVDVTDCDFVGNNSGVSGAIHLTSGSYANVPSSFMIGFSFV